MAQVKSDMAGTLIEYRVKPGDAVKAGQEVAVLESMKMEVPVTAPAGGTVATLLKAPGDFVNEGDALLELR